MEVKHFIYIYPTVLKKKVDPRFLSTYHAHMHARTPSHANSGPFIVDSYE